MASTSGIKRKLPVGDDFKTKIIKISSSSDLDVPWKNQRRDRINDVIDVVERRMPLYKNVISKFLNEVLYEGPLIKIPTSISSELICDIFSYLGRNELEKCQLINRTWKSLIIQHSDFLPLYSFFKLSIEKIALGAQLENCIIQCSIFTSSSSLIIALTYKPTEEEPKRISAMKNYLEALRNVVFQCIEFHGLPYREEERPMERDLMLVRFMDILREYVGIQIRVVFCPLFIGYVSAVTDLFLKSYIKAHKVNIPFDNFLIWLYTSKEINYDNYTKKIKIYVDPVTYPLTEDKTFIEAIFDFIGKCKVAKPNLYRICVNSGLISLLPFFEAWLDFYSNASDPFILVNKFYFYNRRRFLDTRFNLFTSLVMESCQKYKKSIQRVYKKGTNYLYYLFEVKRLTNHILKIEFQFDLDGYEANRYDQYQEFVANQEAPAIEKLELSYFRKIKFFVRIL